MIAKPVPSSARRLEEACLIAVPPEDRSACDERAEDDDRAEQRGSHRRAAASSSRRARARRAARRPVEEREVHAGERHERRHDPLRDGREGSSERLSVANPPSGIVARALPTASNGLSLVVQARRAPTTSSAPISASVRPM